MNTDKICSALLDRLPNAIDPRVDKEWKYTHRNRKTIQATTYHANFEEIYHLPAILPSSEAAYKAYMERILKK
ncbi:MAG: hypothetical protein L0Y56_20095 [Nitrospira sp.]|nr:hypothetical protein [Nitrospira sp.]